MTRALLATLMVSCFAPLVAAGSPRAAADELVAADRAFAAASARTDVVTGLSAMFAPDVILTHAGGIATGKNEAIDALKASPLNVGRIEWAPARVSVSGDGRHGFTAGFMTLHRDGQPATPMKYLAYWEKQSEGWRVLTYKRGIAKSAPPPVPLTYVLPSTTVSPIPDPETLTRHRDSLAAAERAFSNDAQKIGMRAAFTQYGHPEAINLGGPDIDTWLIGNEAVGAGVGGGRPEVGSPVSWGPDVRTIVAGSGDFGVTVGHIVQNSPGQDGKTPPGRPFFTIWKRDSPTGRWLYIAE